MEIGPPRYRDGTLVQQGERVFIPSEQVHGTVDRLIQSTLDQREWNVDEPGVMLQAEEFGLLFISNVDLKSSPLERA